MPFINAHSDINWHYETEGEESEVLLFLHGWGVDKRIWRQQVKYFSEVYKVMTIDLPGHGQSSWKKIPLSAMAGDLKEILEGLKIYSLMIVASSVGGILAFRLYEIFPSAIKKMSFVGSTPKFAKSSDYPCGLDVAQIRKLAAQLNVAYPSIVNIFFRSLFTMEERESRRFKWLQKFRANIEFPMKEALREYLEILEKEDLRETLKRVLVPMQFINGTEDQICDIQTIGLLERLAPQARFDFFPKCGHFPFLSKPHEFNAVLEDFLKS